MISSLYQAQADEYRHKYVNLECEYQSLKNSHAYELSKARMIREEEQLRFNEKLALEVAESQRKQREALLQKDLQINTLERRLIEYETRASKDCEELG